MEYAVVCFLKEDTYSEVPAAWLSDNREQCWWPNCMNVNSYMAKGLLPDKLNWTAYDVRVECYCSTLESARIKAQDPEYSSSTEDKGKGKRKKIPVHRNSSSSEDELDVTPPPVPKTQKKFNGLESKASGSKESGSKESGSKESTTIEHYTVQLDGTLKNVETKNREFEDSTLNEILRVSQETLKYIKELTVEIKKLRSTNGELQGDKIMSKLKILPLKTTEEIEYFSEELGRDEKTKTCLISYVQSIGGRDHKDHMNRCLSGIFTNQVGTLCSYEGRKGNYKLKDSVIMKVLTDVLITKYMITLSECQAVITEWFRLSRQRLTREKK